MLKALDQAQARQTLLDKYLRGEFGYGSPAHLRRHDPLAETPASLSQEQVWLHAHEHAAVPQIYTESITIHRTGPVDIPALKQSLSEILRRHEIWRTTFEMRQGQLCQVIRDVADFPLSVVDLREYPASEREPEVVRVAKEQARQPFDLQRGPLVRALLVSLDDQQHRLYFDMHQIITDGISVFQVLPTELATLYESFATNSASSLSALPRQFADYATWQREWLQGPALQSQLKYWRKRFAAEVPTLPWPNDRTRPPVETHRGAIEPFAVSWEDLDALQKVRRDGGVSLFSSLVAAFAGLLHFYTKQDDIVLGTLAPCGRHQTEFQTLLGYFMNPVALRLRVSGDETFRELMLQAQEVIAGAISHGDVPFEHVVNALGVRPDPSRHPLFQIAISLAPAVAPLPTGWDMTPMDVESGAARWDLYLEMSERPEYLLGRAQYNPDLFDRTILNTSLRDFRRVLKTSGSDPDQRLSDLLIPASADNCERS